MKRNNRYGKKRSWRNQKPMVRNNGCMKQNQQRKLQQEVLMAMVKNRELVVVMVENGELVMAMEVLLLGRYLMIKMAQHWIWTWTWIQLTIVTQKLHLNLPHQ
jgi:ribosome-binding protein aMBF1 (putative translation factor)